MYFVKIDRSSVKNNPNYPATRSYIPTTKHNSITINVTHPLLDEALGKILGHKIDESLCFVTTITNACESLVRRFVVDNQDLKDFLKAVDCDFSQDYIEVTTLPEDPYVYEYEPLEVTCKYCGATFDHTKLFNYWEDHCEVYHEHVCPYCDRSDCVDIEYESVYKVIRESKGGCG